MAILNAAERAKLPASAFAIPEKRAYPIHNADHAKVALAYVAKNGSARERHRVRMAVHEKYPQMGVAGKVESETPAEAKSKNEEPEPKVASAFGGKKAPPFTKGGGK